MTQGGKPGLIEQSRLPAWPEELTEALSSLPHAPRVWVAYSGGLDSTLLLHLARYCLQEARGASLKAIHVNHQLQANAGLCEAHCRRTCEELSVPLVVDTVEVVGAGIKGGIEEAARSARYAAFKRWLEPGDLLLMAHHADDQAETVLFRLIRGTGVAGLAGMPAFRPLGQGALVRPLLRFSQERLRAIAQARNLRWVDDPSNEDQDFDRNFLRRSILPRLRQRWPSLPKRINRTAEYASEQAELADRLAELQFNQCCDDRATLRMDLFARLSVPEQKNLLRWWISGLGFAPPVTRHWADLLAGLMEAKRDRSPEIRGPGYRLRRFNDRLHLVTEEPEIPLSGKTLTPARPVHWAGYTLWLEASSPSRQTAPVLQVTRREGGERLRERSGGPTRPLKKWLQEKGVPPWQRTRLPLVWKAGELVAIGDLWCASDLCGGEPGSGWRLRCER
ncbi:MAG: tRNA lysidine(34) synthetase TilS [Oleiphilaceae bacterium]|nr:tRNA lysidine(34) synthetase TilS [Oleiphilaceae bacterium]